MATVNCTRKIEFDAAHRVIGHENKCKYFHGHRYVVEATFEADMLDTVGRVIDFGCIKEKLGGWIDDNWDHTAILSVEDKALGEAVAQLTKQNIFYLPSNPTAENMAAYLFEEVCPSLFKQAGLRCTKIKLYETPNCYSEAV